MFNLHDSCTIVYVSWATVGASKYVIHMHLSNRSTTENHKQLKYRVIELSLNGYVHKTLLHLRLRGIAWKLVDILIIKFMTFISLCIIHMVAKVFMMHLCVPLWIKVDYKTIDRRIHNYSCIFSLPLWPLGEERQKWHNELSLPLAYRWYCMILLHHCACMRHIFIILFIKYAYAIMDFLTFLYCSITMTY